MTAPYAAAEAAAWMQATLLQGSPDATLGSVCIDSRRVAPGDLFIAIRGPNHDAHEFLPQALAARAAGVVVERGRALPPALAPELPVFAVDDTTRALGRLAAGHRGSFHGPLVAITGSNGKTTTKEMCAAILSVSAPCLRTEGNLNNEFGVPLTLLRRDEAHRRLVIEIGMNHRGEIAPLAALARPSVAVITNVGMAHIENLGSQDEIAREKGDLVAALDPSGIAVLNAEDPRCLAQARRSAARVRSFGRETGDVRAEHVSVLGERGFAFDLVAPEGRAAVHVAGLGAVTVLNALAAAAAALAAGASLADAATGLARYQPIGGRMEPMTLPRNVILINDTYNANPQSMEVALRGLAELKGGSRGLAVLGDMGELGEVAPAAHRAAGQLVGRLGLDFLFVLGDHAEETAAGALEAGMDPRRVRIGRDHEDTSRHVREVLQGNDWVLVKGSRSARMERVVAALAEGAP